MSHCARSSSTRRRNEPQSFTRRRFAQWDVHPIANAATQITQMFRDSPTSRTPGVPFHHLHVTRSQSKSHLVARLAYAELRSYVRA